MVKITPAQVITNCDNLPTIPTIESKILVVRGRHVIIDRDLAEFYAVETGTLNQAAKRNARRFPERYRFQLTKEEKAEVITKCYHLQALKYSPTLPYAYTEHGVTMIAGVLNTDYAIETSIRIVDAFVAMRHYLLENQPLLDRMQTLEQRQLSQENKLESIENTMHEQGNRIDTMLQKFDEGIVQPSHAVFFDNQFFDARVFVLERIKEARKRVILIDNYIDATVLDLLDSRAPGVEATIYTQTKNLQKHLADITKHDQQYPAIPIIDFARLTTAS